MTPVDVTNLLRRCSIGAITAELELLKGTPFYAAFIDFAQNCAKHTKPQNPIAHLDMTNIPKLTTTQVELIQRGLNSLITTPSLLLKVDGLWGDKTTAAYNEFVKKNSTDDDTILRGDGTWPWTAVIDGDDIVLRNVRATCFGGDNDPQDSGQTASGIPTKGNPNLKACSLPMDARMFKDMERNDPGGYKALAGSPIPKVPWKTMVRVSPVGQPALQLDVPVIDLGPGKRTGNALDLTIAAARHFKPSASATNFELRVDVRILGGAQFVA